MNRMAIGLLVFCPLHGCGGDEPSSDSGEFPLGIRHVLLISLDTLRADHLACYGHEFVQSPALDELAREGVVFDYCISSAPTTLASHTSLFTGKYPHTHGVPRNGFEVPDANVMLPEVLREHGFRTAGFAGAAPLDTDVNFHQGFDEYDADFTITEGVREGIFQRPANEVTDTALDWLDGRGAGVDERLFMFLHYYDIHAPYEFPEPYAGMYTEDGVAIDASFENLGSVRLALAIDARAPGQKPREQAPEDGFARRIRERAGPGLEKGRRMVAEYAAGITWTDHHLGRLLSGLRERGLLDETLVIVTSDHGETLFDHANLFNHGVSVYDSESHVPLIMRFPGGRYAGKRVEDVVSNIDFFPTLLSLLELPIPDDSEGVDVSGILEGGSADRGPVFSEATKPFSKPRFNADPLWKNQGKFQAIRTDRYKYMFRIPDQQFRLYDLRSDPTEEHDLLIEGTTAVEVVRDELDAALRYWRESAAPLGADLSDSDDQLKALEALGYAGSDED